MYISFTLISVFCLHISPTPLFTLYFLIVFLSHLNFIPISFSYYLNSFTTFPIFFVASGRSSSLYAIYILLYFSLTHFLVPYCVFFFIYLCFIPIQSLFFSLSSLLSLMHIDYLVLPLRFISIHPSQTFHLYILHFHTLRSDFYYETYIGISHHALLHYNS